MDPDERKASLKRILKSARNLVETVNQETHKAAELIDDDDSYGSLIELLRGAPELIEKVELLPVTLLGCATLLAGELRTEGADDIRDKVEALINKHEAQTVPNHIRELVPILLDCYADEPVSTRTH